MMGLVFVGYFLGKAIEGKNGSVFFHYVSTRTEIFAQSNGYNIS